MPTDCVDYQNSGYFTPLIIDYLNQKPTLAPFYNRFPTLDNFGLQLAEKSNNFKDANRKILVSVLQKQYQNLKVSDLTQSHIESLTESNAFTVTTGHQLNLFTGPLYFLYKIISTINLAKALKIKYPESHFVPLYWMATEDHDFEEINYFNFNGKKFRWHKESAGPVGRLSTSGLEEVLEVFASELGSSLNAATLKKLFKKSYLEHDNLTDATRFLANELFAAKGLVILDADDTELKRQFSPYIKEELLQQTSCKCVIETSEKLKDYGVQVNPRAINLFYLEDHLRERIILEGENYKVNNTQILFSRSEILSLLEKNPEKFSPNVILRPLYQEVILPNLCYIGGGGELSYWLELKSYFDSANVTFPMLLLRNSVLLATEKQAKKADNLALTWKDLFSKPADLYSEKTKGFSEFPVDLSIQKDHLKTQFHYLELLAQQTDPSFLGAVKAQQAKQIKGLEHLEKRLLKAQKRKYADVLQRIANLQQALFPNQNLQERQANFSEFYLEYGLDLIDRLQAELHPLDTQFSVLVL